MHKQTSAGAKLIILSLFAMLYFNVGYTEQFLIPQWHLLTGLSLPSIGTILIQRLQYPKTLISMGVLLLLSSNVVSTLFSANPHLSLLGRDAQPNGLAQFAIYFTIYWLAHQSRLEQFTPVIVSLTGIELLSSFLLPLEHDGSFRIVGTMGNANHYATWLAMVFPIVGYWAYRNKNNLYGLLGIVLSIGCLYGLYLSMSRSTVFSIVTMGILILLRRFGIKKKTERRLYMAGVGLATIAIAFMPKDGYPEQLGLARLTSIQDNRWLYWQESLEAIPSLKQLFIGRGVDTVGLMGIVHPIDNTIDITSLHNVILDTYHTMGLMGIVGWVLIVWGFYRRWNKARGYQYSVGLAIGLRLFALLFHFQTVATEPLFFTLLAIFDSNQPYKSTSISKNYPLLGGILVLISILTVLDV